MISSADIKSNLKLNTTSIGYSFDITSSNWDGTFRDTNGNVLNYYFDVSSKATITNQAFFTTAFASWSQYSVLSFSEDNQSPNIVVYQADTNSNVPAPNVGATAEGWTFRDNVIDSEYDTIDVATLFRTENV